jgi:hypothetical protein
VCHLSAQNRADCTRSKFAQIAVSQRVPKLRDALFDLRARAVPRASSLLVIEIDAIEPTTAGPTDPKRNPCSHRRSTVLPPSA